MLPLDASRSPGIGIRCRLHRNGDRWRTIVDRVSGDGAVRVLLESIEGDASDDWPPSPPLQDCQQIPALPNAILATGMAGNAHWSLAAEIRTIGGDQVSGFPAKITCLVWDVACRIRKGEPTTLGSHYSLGPEVVAEMLADNKLRLQQGNASSVLFAIETDAGTPRGEIRLDRDPAIPGTVIVQLIPSVTVGDDIGTPRTVRWKYGLTLALEATPPASYAPEPGKA